MVTAPTCSDNIMRKREKTQANRNLIKLGETSLTDVRNTYCWTWQEKSLNWSNKKRLLLNARFTVHFVRLESARVESDNVHTFSLVEKAPVTVKCKIPMCWTHGLPWELVETKWQTNIKDCSYHFAVLTSFIQESSTIKKKDWS